MLINQPVNEFIDIVASEAPAPGGGSVAALAGTLAAGLVVMVCNLTLGKPKYDPIKEELQTVRNRAERLKQQLLELVDKDTESFNRVMAAYKLPKDSEPARKVREEAIAKAAKGAAQVPMVAAQLSLEVLMLTETLATKANPNAITDIGVAARTAEAGLQGAVYNVRINLGAIRDAEFTVGARHRCEEWLAQASQVLARVQKQVESQL